MNKSIEYLIKTCGETTIAKGFDCSQHLKQLLLIADEVREALEHITISTETDKSLMDVYNNFHAQFMVLKVLRKNIDMQEITSISNKKELALELADIIIRVFSYSHINNLPLEESLLEKIEYNKTREFLHGKKF